MLKKFLYNKSTEENFVRACFSPYLYYFFNCTNVCVHLYNDNAFFKLLRLSNSKVQKKNDTLNEIMSNEANHIFKHYFHVSKKGHSSTMDIKKSFKKLPLTSDIC